MDDLDRDAELAQLIAEQKADDSPQVIPEFRNTVPVDAIENLLGLTADGDVISFEKHERGSVLIGSADWHGTFGGYTNRKCRCKPCKAANAEHQRKRRAKRAAQ